MLLRFCWFLASVISALVYTTLVGGGIVCFLTGVMFAPYCLAVALILANSILEGRESRDGILFFILLAIPVAIHWFIPVGWRIWGVEIDSLKFLPLTAPLLLFYGLPEFHQRPWADFVTTWNQFKGGRDTVSE